MWPKITDLPVCGLGIDIIRIGRIARAYRRRPERFLERIFTPRERETLRRKKNFYPSLAGRFAAKEAIAKALGCGIGAVGWRELEILPGKQGKPTVFLHGNARSLARRLKVAGIKVSLSHDGSYAVAAAIAYGKRATKDKKEKKKKIKMKK